MFIRVYACLFADNIKSITSVLIYHIPLFMLKV